MRHILLGGAACLALAAPMSALAQSTGTIDFEETIVVTGVTTKDIGGVQSPKTSKAKSVLTQEIIARQAPGQTIDDIINLVPGVSFQNNDPFGSAGGTLTIRGFDASRISQTFDGLPLNDSGNYALYSNQQLDPELIEQVNVNLGTTDVDSPTASATGSTVNIRSITPSDDFGGTLSGSFGDFDFFRVFGVVQTGVFTPWGTKAFFSASRATNNNIFGGGQIDKQQYNAKVYQPIGDNGDFVSLAGHYNENRNNFFGSVALRYNDSREVPDRFPKTEDERFYTVAACETDTPEAGVEDTPNSCGTSYDERFNPSNTGNIRLNSRFTLTDRLVLTIDGGFQYVKANGGGTATGYEYGKEIDGVTYYGYIGGKPYTGVDLNGDGDLLDAVTVLQPSQTQTHRWVAIASLRYDISEDQLVRLAYTYDHAKHRQTGQIGYLNGDGSPVDVFPVNDPIQDVLGIDLNKRNRLSYAILHQVSGEYRGSFLNGRLNVNAGLRAPFFTRDLDQRCYTTSASGYVDCLNGSTDGTSYDVVAASEGYSLPQKRKLKYDDILPNVGLTFEIVPQTSIFANYSRGIQVPGTDNLYNSFYFAANSDAAHPKPETTDNFDLGLRYSSGTVQAQITGWYTNYQNRLASSYDPETDTTIYRNLGKVERYGFDGSIAFKPISQVTLYAFGSYLKSKIKDNVQTGTDADGNPIYAYTKGKREANAPEYTFGGRAQVGLGPVELGVQAKRTGPRYVNDQNLPVESSSGDYYPARTPAYTLVDLDARVTMGWAGLNDKTYVQLNMLNVFDEFYVGGLSSLSVETTRAPYSQIGYPRTFMASLVVGF